MSDSLFVYYLFMQAYGLDDPVGNSYGNKNFQDIEDYMFFEAQLGNRSVQYYGETSYWYK